MTPPQDLLERLEIFLAKVRAAPPPNPHLRPATFVQATPDLVTAIGNECIDEISRLRAEVDTLRAERQPFRTLMDECARLGLLNAGLPGDVLPPEVTIEAMLTSPKRLEEIEKRTVLANESRAANEAAVQLAERLGFKKPDTFVDLEEAHRRSCPVKAKYRGVIFSAQVVEVREVPEVFEDYSYDGRVHVVHGNTVVTITLRGAVPRLNEGGRSR